MTIKLPKITQNPRRGNSLQPIATTSGSVPVEGGVSRQPGRLNSLDRDVLQPIQRMAPHPPHHSVSPPRRAPPVRLPPVQVGETPNLSTHQFPARYADRVQSLRLIQDNVPLPEINHLRQRIDVSSNDRLLPLHTIRHLPPIQEQLTPPTTDRWEDSGVRSVNRPVVPRLDLTAIIGRASQEDLTYIPVSSDYTSSMSTVFTDRTYISSPTWSDPSSPMMSDYSPSPPMYNCDRGSPSSLCNYMPGTDRSLHPHQVSSPVVPLLDLSAVTGRQHKHELYRPYSSDESSYEPFSPVSSVEDELEEEQVLQYLPHPPAMPRPSDMTRPPVHVPHPPVHDPRPPTGQPNFVRWLFRQK